MNCETCKKLYSQEDGYCHGCFSEKLESTKVPCEWENCSGGEFCEKHSLLTKFEDKYEDILKQGFVGKFDVTTRELNDSVKVTFYCIHNNITCKLFNIKELRGDFNFHDIEADWFDGVTQKHGKFYYKDLIIK